MVLLAHPALCSVLMGGCKDMVQTQCCHWFTIKCSYHYNASCTDLGANEQRWVHTNHSLNFQKEYRKQVQMKLKV